MTTGFDHDYEQSLALHAAVAEKLRQDPAVLARARAKLAEWLARGGRSSPLWQRWSEILDRPVDEVLALLTERSEDAAWLRKASPFAGALSPRERLAVMWRVRGSPASSPT
jgi:hypothetical protein